MKTLVLAVLFLGLVAFNTEAQKTSIVVYLVGDSTLANKAENKRPETGWGEMLQQYFDEKKVKIDNHAQNGRSTKSFINEGRWQKVVDSLKKGDYVFVQFGHNDEKVDKPNVGTVANTEYRNNLIKFVNEVRAKKAFPVLLTPVMRRRFDEKDEFYDTHGEYPDAVRKVANELKVPLIDMTRKSEVVIKKYGVEDSKKLFLHFKEGELPNYPKGVADDTHFSTLGAEEMAKLAVEGIKETKINLAKLLIKK